TGRPGKSSPRVRPGSGRTACGSTRRRACWPPPAHFRAEDRCGSTGSRTGAWCQWRSSVGAPAGHPPRRSRAPPSPPPSARPDAGSLALFETSAISHGARPKGWRGDVVLYEAGSWTTRWVTSVDAQATGDPRSLAKAGHGMGFLTEVLFADDEALACGATGGLVLFYRASDGKLLRRGPGPAQRPGRSPGRHGGAAGRGRK